MPISIIQSTSSQIAIRSPPMAPPITAYLTAFTLLITTAAAATTGYNNHTVGGAAGWFFNATTNKPAANYSSWAATQTFNLGDYLIFKTNSNQSVVQTYNVTTYRSCTADDSDNGTFVYGGGSGRFGEALTVAVPLTIEGSNYYFSDAGYGSQCRGGLAFEIAVKRGIGLPPSLNQPPPPPYTAPPGPDTPQSPPFTEALPPNGGVFASRANVRVVVCAFAATMLFLQLQ